MNSFFFYILISYCILSLFIAYAIILQDEKDKGGRSDIDNLETEYLQKKQKKKQG
jgi:phosphotransferase system  glucose/maltose/N-acetylglucosamine-specific IIC component